MASWMKTTTMKRDKRDSRKQRRRSAKARRRIREMKASGQIM